MKLEEKEDIKKCQRATSGFTQAGVQSRMIQSK